MDIGEHVRAATDRLERAGCGSPRLDAELLLACVLGLGRAGLYARWQDAFSHDRERAYRDLVQRRADREPLAYVVGHKEFFGLEFEVDRRVLVPRPETELLVEMTIEEAGRIAPDGALTIADIGTGSGVIAVSLAVNLPAATVYAVDLSNGALAVAARNCERHGVGCRVRLIQGDLLQELPSPVDIIVANLPYVSSSELETTAPEIREFEPLEALHGGEDGLDLIRLLLEEIVERQVLPQRVLLEIGATQGQRVLGIIRDIWPGAEAVLSQDYAGHDRNVTVRL